MFITFFIYFFIFLLGVCIGSFLNCVIYRMELQEKMPAGPERKAVSFLRGKSFCPHCRHTLSWQDLFPVLSFLFLGGKCRYCRKRISIQYPVVELATGITFLMIFNSVFPLGLAIFNGFSIFQFISLVFLLYAVSALIVIFIYDLKHFIIPDKVLFPAIAIALAYDLISFSHFLNFLIAVIVAAGFFLSIFLVSKGKWMGFGDVKLAVLMGLMLGFPNILTALFLAFFFGAIIGVILMVFPDPETGEKKKLKSEIPFGPFLIAGTFIAMFCGSQLIQWYMHLLI